MKVILGSAAILIAGSLASFGSLETDGIQFDPVTNAFPYSDGAIIAAEYKVTATDCTFMYQLNVYVEVEGRHASTFSSNPYLEWIDQNGNVMLTVPCALYAGSDYPESYAFYIDSPFYDGNGCTLSRMRIMVPVGHRYRGGTITTRFVQTAVNYHYPFVFPYNWTIWLEPNITQTVVIDPRHRTNTAGGEVRD